MSNKNSDYYFLKGGGEMGELIRAKDWSKTSLGDPADWPQSLKTMVAVMLDNPFGMYIAWGNDYIQLYNDGYRPILGATKHPKALGISTRETFSEIWDNIIGSMFDGVMKGKAVGFPDLMLPLDRNGFIEECYFDFAYSPIREDNGEVGGVLVTVVETTNKKKTEEALKESEARFRAIADDAPVFIFLAGENAEVEYLNKTWREYTGISTDDSKGRAWAEITHIDDIEPATKIYMDGFNRRESCSFENRQKGIDGIYRTILWKATPRFSTKGQFIGMMGVGLDIHERKKSEEKLRESEQRLRLANEASGVAVWEWDVITGQIKWDNEMFKIYGVTPTVDNLVDYTTWSTAVVPEELAEQENILQNTVKNKGQSSRSFNIKRASDGELRQIEAIEIVRTNEAGQVEWIVGTNLDVTEKMVARKTIEERKRLYETITQNTPDLIYVFDLNYRFTYANEALLKMWGRSFDDSIGKGMLELGYEPWHAEMHEREIDKVIATKKPVRGEVSFPHASLGMRMYDYIFAPVINENSEVEAVTGTTRDISDIKNAEEELKGSKEQFSTLADNMENLAWLADGEGWIYWYNKRWLEYTGLTLEEMQGWGWQKVHHPDHVERVLEASKKIWHVNETFELTFPLRRHDGEYRWFLTRGYPLTNEEGKIIRWIGTNTDIDEHKKAEEQFRVLADQTPMWVWLTDKEVNVLYANSELLRFIGISHYTEFTGRLWEEKVHPEDIELVYKSFGEAAMLQQSFSLEYRVQNAITQQYEWFYIKGVPHLKDGEFAGFIGTGININEQKSILSELQYRTALLESHNEANLDGILLVDTKGKILSYNNRFVEIWNMPQQIVLEKDDEKALEFALTQLINPEKFIEKVAWLYENPNETSVDELEFSDGKIIKRYGYHVVGADEKYYGCSWIFRDITEQRNSEKTLKQSEERFRSLVQTLPQLVWITDAEGNQEFSSSRWKEYSGVEPDGEREWRKIVHPEDYDNINAAWTRSLNTGTSYTFNVRLKSKLGEYRWHIVKGEPVFDAANNIVKWVGSFTDIHEHKKAEEQFRQMAERMPQKVWTADALGNRNYFNQVMLDYTGLSFEELKDWGWKKIIHPEDWPHTKQKWEQSITTGDDFENETRLLRKDGKYLWHLVRSTAIKDEKGKPKMWIGSKTEIQEQVELSETLGENLKRSNERMQTILQHAPDAVIAIDEEGIIKSWNYEAELIFGWKEHEVIEKTLTETIIPKRYRDGHDMGMKHFLRTGEGPVINKPIELSALKKNGSEFPVELKISTSKINNSYIFIGFIRDISIRKAAEETIQNKTNQLIEAQELAHIGSWEWDVPTNKIYWSDELYRIYGLSPQEFEADYDNFIKYVYPDDREYVNATVQQAFKDHQPYRFFHKTASADGNVRILSATGKVFTDGDGNVIRMSGTAQDVTAQKRYEEELKISEERFFKIFDSNPIPMTLTEIKTNKIKYANNLFYNAFGYTKEEVIGNSSEELNLIDTEEYKRVIDLIFGYLHENRSLAEVQALSKEETETLLLRLKQSEKMKDFEICYTRKNGETFPAIVSFELIRIGTESYTVTSYQDISLRKKAEEKLRIQNDQLEKMNQELQSFAYISSHDLQEPLRKIQTFATRIIDKERNNLSESGIDMLNRMQNSANRMQILIQDLLAYSRTSETEYQFETTDLNKIIEEVKEDLQEELNDKNAVIQASQLCDVNIIPFQFRQLMLNLVSNALKFSKPNHPPIIKIKSEVVRGIELQNPKLLPQRKYCHITVSDNGIGFEEQYSEKIFEVFQRLHGRHEYIGTGIGLSIVKKIVDNHHGIITATGEVNKGATFDINIPVE